MVSEFRYEIKNFVTCFWLEKIWHKKSGLVRTQRTRNNDQLILVDPVEDEDPVHGLILQTSDFDLKKWKNY
jgi:hypothetical protein